MDYEKKYKEALEIVMAYYNRTKFNSIINSQEEKETLERAFPELKESEDERIRLFLIKKFEEVGDIWPEYSPKKIIAYLEKQKEQKHYTYEQSKQAAEDCYYDKGYNTENGGRCNQQSFLWGFEEGVDWCEQHKEHQPTEWSEEDENRFRNLIYLVEHSNEGKGTKEGFVKFINRLKSLRPQPHWKPSTEQLEALDWVVNSINSPIVGFLRKQLRFLYESLKKL